MSYRPTQYEKGFINKEITRVISMQIIPIGIFPIHYRFIVGNTPSFNERYSEFDNDHLSFINEIYNVGRYQLR